MTLVVPLPRRLWPNVEIWSDPKLCWPWRGSVDPKGYGKLKTKGKWVSSHRLAYELTNGPIPPGLAVCHACDNPLCCNPWETNEDERRSLHPIYWMPLPQQQGEG